MEFNDNGILGFDVSKWQRIEETNPPRVLEIDFAMMKAFGTRFVIIKAGQHSWMDPGFLYNWRHARESGIPRGSYFFLDIDGSPTLQARKHWELIKDDIGEGPHAVDFETGSPTNLDALYVYINEFQQKSGLPDHKIPVYTGYPFWTEARATSVAQRYWFAKYPLWLAWYTNNPINVKIPFPWNKVYLWQYGTPPIGPLVGVRSIEVDANKFNGTEEQFSVYFGDTTPVPPDEDEDMISYYEVRSSNTTQTRTIRSGPRITNAPIGSMAAGISSMAKARVDDVFTFAFDSYDSNFLRAKAGDQWVHVFEVNGIAVNGWMAVKHMGEIFTTLRLITPTPTPSEEYILHVRDGVTRRFDLSE